MCARRLANSLSEDVGKLGFRGTICNGEAKWEHAKMGHAPPIWFVFSGARRMTPYFWALALPPLLLSAVCLNLPGVALFPLFTLAVSPLRFSGLPDLRVHVAYISSLPTSQQ